MMTLNEKIAALEQQASAFGLALETAQVDYLDRLNALKRQLSTIRRDIREMKNECQVIGALRPGKPMFIIK